MTDQSHYRCQPQGHACLEVTARVAAGLQAIHVSGCPEQGRRLLETAQRIAKLHNFGQAKDTET